MQDTIRVLQKRRLYDWIKKVILSEKREPGNISVILCSDEFLLDLNKKFLRHNYYTDIITFDYSEEELVSGELYISVDRVRENAELYEQSLREELNRVIIHGVLHLCGYQDKTELETKVMRKKETQKLKMLEK